MRYITWKLVWKGDYGYGPESTAANIGQHMEASSFCDADVETGTILGYLFGDADISNFSDWDAVELSQEDALSFALAINPESYITENGYISAPPSES